MNEVIKYARTVLNGIEKRPIMYGDALSVELQYLLALEFLVIAQYEGIEKSNAVNIVRETYHKELENKFNTSVFPAAIHNISIEDVINLMKIVRSKVDASSWKVWDDIEIDLESM